MLKSQTPANPVYAGTAVTIVVTETNTGDDPLTNVNVTGTGCTTYTPASTSLAVGASADFTCTFSPAVDTAWSATGHGTDSLGNPAPAAGETVSGNVDTITPATALTFVSQSPADPVPANASVTLTVTETNTGDDPLTNVAVSGTNSCLSWTAAGTKNGGGAFTGSLAPGESVNFTCTFTVGTTDVSWSATGSGTDSLGNPAPSAGETVNGTIHVAPPGQGCTPGFWQGGLGLTLWDQSNDSDWTAHGGVGTNPFTTTTVFDTFFTATGTSAVDNMTMLQIVGTGGTSNWARKAARDLIAAYLNASFGLQYPYTTSTILSDWSVAVTSGTSGFQAFHDKYSAANMLGCPIS